MIIYSKYCGSTILFFLNGLLAWFTLWIPNSSLEDKEGGPAPFDDSYLLEQAERQ